MSRKKFHDVIAHGYVFVRVCLEIFINFFTVKFTKS